MHPATPLVMLMMLAPALAGCVNAPSQEASGPGVEPPEARPPDPLSASFAWGLTDCQAVVALVPVEAARVRAHLPAGITPARPSEAGLPPPADAMGDALFAVEAFTCRDVAGGNASTPNGTYGSVFTVVSAPAGQEDPDVDFLYLYKWDTLIVDPSFRTSLQGLGVPAVDGTAAVTLAPTGAQGFASASLTLGAHTYGIEATGATPPGRFGGTFIDFGPGPHGTLAVWKATGLAPAFSQGQSTVDFPAGSLGREIVGSAQGQGFAALGHVPAFEKGTLRFVAWP